MAFTTDAPTREPDRAAARPQPLIDPFARAITYLRVSVTDRCDFRCVYCMSEHMTFLPKADVLSLEELDRLCSAFIAKGVTKLRLTGGEPLVRRGIMTLVSSLSRHLESGALEELTLTTNASQLSRYASELKAHGVERINVSLDTLDPDKFRAITRWGELDKVMAGIDAAQSAGLQVKINAVALKGVNEDELGDMLTWANGRGMDMTIIEVMPLGDVDEGRLDQYLPLSMVRARLAERFTLEDIDYRTGGPARYLRVKETGGRLGLITPLTHNFCESCNRVRITCTGTLKQQPARKIALCHHRIGCTVNMRKRVILGHQVGMHALEKAGRPVALFHVGHADQPDDIAQRIGLGDIRRNNPADADSDNIVEIQLRAKRNARQNRQLVCGIDAIDVEGRVRLGVTHRLCLCQNLGEIGASVFHG